MVKLILVLSQDLNIPVAKAKAYIENYFDNYNKIKEFMDNSYKRC